jgi:hypothetical protein
MLLSASAYRVLEDIDNYNRIGGLMNERCRLAADIYAMKEMSAPRNKAIMTLLKLQNWGITDHEILKVYEFLSSARHMDYSNWCTHKAKSGLEPVFRASNGDDNEFGTTNRTSTAAG